MRKMNTRIHHLLHYNLYCSIIIVVKMRRINVFLTKENRQLSNVESNAEGWIVALSRLPRMQGH